MKGFGWLNRGKKAVEKKIILAFVRHALTLGAGVLVTQGYLDGGEVETLVGALMGLVGVGLSVMDKQKTEPKE